MTKTHLKKSLVALMLVAAGSSANAYEFLNGYGNGLSPNGLTSNGLTQNALSGNGYQLNGGGTNGLKVNGGGENGWLNGVSLNGREMNGREMNGHTMTPDTGRAAEKPEGESKLPRLERSASPLPAPMISSRRIAE